MKMFISLGYLSIKMLIPLLIPALYFARHYLLDIFDKRIDDAKSEEIKHQSVFLNTFIISISYSLNIFLFIIEYNRTRSSRKKIQEKEFDNQLIIEKLKMEKKQKQYRTIFLILLPLFNFFNHLSYDIVGMFKPPEYNKNFFYPISIPFFFIITAFMSYLFLNFKFYLHQKISMIISPILSLALLVILILIRKEKEKANNTLISVLFLIECLGLKSLRYILYVFGKLFMEKLFVSHIKLMTFLGVFGVLFSLIVNFLFIFIKMNFIQNPDLNDYFEIENGNKRLKNIFDSLGKLGDYNWLILIGIIILWFFENYIVWFCIYAFSPNHYTIYSSINSLSSLLLALYGKEKWYIVFAIFALCGVFFCGLVFNEIIIIRLCNMDKNTNVEINRRQKEEAQISMVKYDDRRSNNRFTDNSFDSDMSTKDNRSSCNSLKSN